MRKNMITTNTGEIERLRILRKVMERRLAQVRRAETTGVTNRHVRRILEQVPEKRTEYQPSWVSNSLSRVEIQPRKPL